MEEAERLEINIFINYRERNFIKAVIQAIPTYFMSCHIIQIDLCEHIESMISKFWWGSKQGEHRLHWINWETL